MAGRSSSQENVWTELSLLVQPGAVEAAAELLLELTGNGVAIEPPVQALGPDEGYLLDETAPHTLRAYSYGRVEPARRRVVSRRLRFDLAAAVVGRLCWRTLREEDWAEAWKAHHDLERVGRVVVRPAWRAYEPGPGEVVVSLDPGMAFGTGQHPTTRMCLLALQQVMEEQGTANKEEGRRSERVLDLGCGSGVLALAAVALGAGYVLAVDTEEQAVAATRSNAALNGMEALLDVRLGSMEVVENDGPFDLVLANINAATLSTLAGEMARALKPAGTLVAAGIIAEREEGCLAALEAAGLTIAQRLSEGDWRTFVLRRS